MRNLHYNCEGHASTIFTQRLDEIQGSKSTLIHGFTQRDYTPGKINHFNYTLAEKKKRQILKNFSKQVTSTLGNPLTFKSKHGSSYLDFHSSEYTCFCFRFPC